MEEGAGSQPAAALGSQPDELTSGVLRTLVDQLPFAVALLASDDLRFLYANPVFETWLAPQRPSLAGRRASEVLNVATGVAESCATAVQEGRNLHFHRAAFPGLPNLPVTVPGDLTPWDWSIQPLRLGTGPEVSHLLLTGVDVTRSEVEQMRLKALEQGKSDFLGLAAHELRGPLAVLNGYLSMFEAGSIPGITGDAAETVPVLAGQARRMGLLVDQMLEVARLEDDRLELSETEFDLRDAAQEAMGELRLPEGSAHGLGLELPARRVLVRADWGRVLLILANLLDNAIKYSPEGGPVACRVSGSGGTAVVEVSDRGIGIAADEVGSLFTRFGRLPGGQHLPGTGLGLYLCRRLARRMEGDVTVRSRPGDGSVFKLELPGVRTVAAGA